MSESPLYPRHTFYFHCLSPPLSLPWNCDDRASGRQRHLEESPPLNPPHRDFNHDPSLEGSLRRDLNELPQVRRGHRRCRRASPFLPVTFLKGADWLSSHPPPTLTPSVWGLSWIVEGKGLFWLNWYKNVQVSGKCGNDRTVVRISWLLWWREDLMIFFFIKRGFQSLSYTENAHIPHKTHMCPQPPNSSTHTRLQHFLFRQALNTVACIFTIPFSPSPSLFPLSLPPSLLLLWRTNGEKSIQYTGYWSTPITAEKKVSSEGGCGWAQCVCVCVRGSGGVRVVEGVGSTGHANR